MRDFLINCSTQKIILMVVFLLATILFPEIGYPHSETGVVSSNPGLATEWAHMGNIDGWMWLSPLHILVLVMLVLVGIIAMRPIALEITKRQDD